MDDLLFSSWQPWKASGIIQSKCEGLRTREADGVNFSPRAGEDKAKMFQLKEWSRKNRQISSFSTLGSIQVLDGSDDAHIGDSKLLLRVYCVKGSPHLEASSQEHSETMFNEATGCATACQADI